MRSLLLALPLLVAITSRGRAEPCPPSVALTGDPDLVAEVSAQLVQRGVDVSSAPACAPMRVRVEHRGERISVEQVGRPEDAHEVAELVAVTTLIESWSQTDLESPLLAVHHVPAGVASPVASLTATVGVAAPPLRGMQLFVDVETSMAEDRSTWLGTGIGVCVMLGPVCAAARARVSATAFEPFENDVRRRAIDVLFGGDIPLAFGATTVSPGFAAGLGAVHSQEMTVGGSETFGLRADAHVVWSIPIWSRLSVDLSASTTVTQVIDVEASSGRVADEPRFLGRFGAGLRYGAL